VHGRIDPFGAVGEADHAHFALHIGADHAVEPVDIIGAELVAPFHAHDLADAGLAH